MRALVQMTASGSFSTDTSFSRSGLSPYRGHRRIKGPSGRLGVRRLSLAHYPSTLARPSWSRLVVKPCALLEIIASCLLRGLDCRMRVSSQNFLVNFCAPDADGALRHLRS